MENKTEKKMGVSPITNTIYYGKMNSKEEFTGDQVDVTKMAIASVFQWFLNQMNDRDEFSISYPGVPDMELKMVRKEI